MDEQAEKEYRELFTLLCKGLAEHGRKLNEALQHESHNLESAVAHEAGAQLYALSEYMETMT